MPATAKEKGNPPHSVDWKDLASIYAQGTPNNADPVRQDDYISYENLFAVYYPSSELTVDQTDMSRERKQNAEAASIHDAWQWIGLESKRGQIQRRSLVRLLY